VGAHLRGVLLGPATRRVVEVAEREEVHMLDAGLGGAGAHGFMEMGGNED
jgi:hypothetical protein